METNQKTKDTLVCEDCKKLIGGHRHIQPHENLVLTEYKPVSSMFGTVDEYYYKCRNCSKLWLRDTGSYGEGWVE